VNFEHHCGWFRSQQPRGITLKDCILFSVKQGEGKRKQRIMVSTKCKDFCRHYACVIRHLLECFSKGYWQWVIKYTYIILETDLYVRQQFEIHNVSEVGYVGYCTRVTFKMSRVQSHNPNLPLTFLHSKQMLVGTVVGLLDDHLLLRNFKPYVTIFMNVSYYNRCHS
jgi:hypothetical protein